MEHWTKLIIGSNVYIVKFDTKSDENHELFTFWLSNFKTLWTETINTKDQLFQRFADENASLTIDDDNTNQLIGALGTFAKYFQCNAEIKPNDEEIKFQFKLSLDGGVFTNFHWLLKKCAPEIFFDQVTKSLLHQIGELEESKKHLNEIVKKKDDEIRQYGLEGAPPLMRKKFITEPFDETVFTARPQMFNCDISDFEAVLGPLSTYIAPEEPKREVSPLKPPNHGRNARAQQKIVKLGEVSYESSDDDQPNEQVKTQNEVKTETNVEITEQEAMEVTPPKLEPNKPRKIKRIRREFHL